MVCNCSFSFKVCKFLRERGLEDEVIEKVKEEKVLLVVLLSCTY